MALPKPSNHLTWTDGDSAKVVEPSAPKKLLGWVALERPPFEYFNWLFFRTDEWLQYLESVTDETALARVDAIVDEGGNGTHLTLQDAHDDANVQSGSTILITSDLDLDTTVTITKADIEIRMQPGYRFHKGGSAPASNFTGVQIQATADRCRLKNLAFGSAVGGEQFSGSGDLALEIASGASDVYVENPIFVAGNTADLTDSGTNTLIVAPQSGLSQ